MKFENLKKIVELYNKYEKILERKILIDTVIKEGSYINFIHKDKEDQKLNYPILRIYKEETLYKEIIDLIKKHSNTNLEELKSIIEGI